MILGHNFSKAYHIGMLWNADDVMSLTKNGIPFAEMYALPFALGQRGGHTLAGIVCLSHCLDTDPHTLIVTHMKDL